MPVCLYCRKSDKLRGEWCDRCFAWVSNGPPPAKCQHWFTKGQPGDPPPDTPPEAPPAAPVPVPEPPRRRNPYGLPPPDDRLSDRQRELLARLRSTGDWLACDAGVGKALVRRGLAESEPRGPGRRLLFRSTLCPGPYAVQHEPGGPGWQVIDTRTADPSDRIAAACDAEPAARLKANALNVRFQADAANPESPDAT